jgi:hypothetical protein
VGGRKHVRFFYISGTAGGSTARVKYGTPETVSNDGIEMAITTLLGQIVASLSNSIMELQHS